MRRQSCVAVAVRIDVLLSSLWTVVLPSRNSTVRARLGAAGRKCILICSASLPCQA